MGALIALKLLFKYALPYINLSLDKGYVNYCNKIMFSAQI